MIRILKYIVSFVVLVGLLFLVFLVYMTIVDYTPASKTNVFKSDKADILDINDTLSCLTWNIGYAGLDADMDFFYDGGTQVRPTHSKSLNNLKHIANYLENKSNLIDFYFIQEIDINSKRSYCINQVDTIASCLCGFNSYFGKNYSVNWVPIPIFEPMGNVESGIALFSSYKPYTSDRYSFPVNFNWPLKVFMLDRCFLVTRYPTSNNKELVVIVTHNSAFDKGGELRKAELIYFRDFLQQEYDKGNYVIAGGDFNQCPAGYNADLQDSLFDTEDFHTIPDSLFTSNWHFVYDRSLYTNRRVIAPYDSITTKQTLIDFYITSPNVSTVFVKTENLNYCHSDHNPVLANFILNH